MYLYVLRHHKLIQINTFEQASHEYYQELGYILASPADGLPFLAIPVLVLSGYREDRVYALPTSTESESLSACPRRPGEVAYPSVYALLYSEESNALGLAS
jgi:hypothetical protein